MNATLGLYLLSGGLLLAAVISGIISGWSLRWPKAKGVIKVSIYDREWQDVGTGSETNLKKVDKFYLAFSFEIAGTEYLASSIRPNGDFDWTTTTPGVSSAAERANWYREGKAVDVFYCPAWPKLCCLEPGGALLPALLAFGSVVLFFIARAQS